MARLAAGVPAHARRGARLHNVADVGVLDREMYSEAEAARLLGVAQSTLNYWLEGGVRRGKSYRPIIRTEATGGRSPVTWAEFVEAGLLRSYRRDLGVRMAELREFIDLLRTEFDVPYPLADRRPYVSGRDLVYEAQERSRLDPEFWIVSNVGGQLLLLPARDLVTHRHRRRGAPGGQRAIHRRDRPSTPFRQAFGRWNQHRSGLGTLQRR